MKALKCVVLSLSALALAPSIALAQACIGTPAGQGQYAIEGAMGIGDGFKSYGGGVLANLAGPMSFGGSFGITKPDAGGDNITSFGGQAAFDLMPASRLSACPTVGASYSTFSTDVLGTQLDMSQITVPVGVGLGTTLPAGNTVNLTVFAVPAFLWSRVSAEANGQSDSESSNEFGLNTGIRLGTASFYAGGGVGITTADNSDPVFNFGIGLVVGRSR